MSGSRFDARESARNARVIFARELHAYFDTPIAYVFSTAFLLLSSSVFMNAFFLAGVLDMSRYFEDLPFLLVLFIPAVTMRVWSEERTQRTFELLMTLPVRSLEVVLGKYLAAVAFYLIVLAGSLPIVAMLVTLGDPDLGLILSAYAGAVLLGAFFLSFGIFASGLTGDQISAFILAAMLGCLFTLSGHEKTVEVLDGLAPGAQLGSWIRDSISVMPRYASFRKGVLSAADAFYFLAMIAFFLGMNDLTLRRSKS